MNNRDYGEAPGITQQNIVEEGTPSMATLAPIGIVGTAPKGSLDLTLVSNEAMSRGYFGKSTGNNTSVKAIEVCLRNNKRVWFKRVVSKTAKKATTWTEESGMPLGVVAPTEEKFTKFVSLEGYKIVVDTDKFDTLTDEEKADVCTRDDDQSTEDKEVGIISLTVSYQKPSEELKGVSATVTFESLTQGDWHPLKVDKENMDILLGTYEKDADGYTCVWGTNVVEPVVTWSNGETTKVVVAWGTESDPDPEVKPEVPKCVFTAKEISEEMNGWSAQIVINEEKIIYNLISEGNYVEERFEVEIEKGDSYFEMLINRYSKYVQLDVNPDAEWEDYTAVFGGGDSGMDVTEEDIIEGLQYFADNEQSDIQTLIVPGWFSPAVWHEATKIVESRGDAMYIPSFPPGLKAEQVADMVKQSGEYFDSKVARIDNTRVAFYWPNGILKNEVTGRDEIVDIAPYVASAWSRSDNLEGIESAPAGVVRGIIQGLSGLECRVVKRDRDMLYHETVNVNSIIKDAEYGILISGVRTSKVYDIMSTNKSLRYVNAMRMVDYLYREINRESKKVNFDQNTRVAWNKWKMNINPHLSKMKDRGGLYDYQIIMDETTVTQENVDNGEMPGIIRVAIIKPNEYIRISFMIAADGVTSFAVEEEGVNSNE